MTKLNASLVAFCLLLLSVATSAAVYNGGRCDGSATLYGGDVVRFYPGDNPTPRYLWILVQQGQGSTLIQNSNGDITSSLYLNTFDMLLLEPMEWINFQFQGGAMKIYYGGTNINPPQYPICNTGSLGPVLMLTDELRNVAIQSGASGPPGIQASIYQKVEAKVNGSYSYKLLSNLQLWTQKTATACSGASCCNPKETTFIVKNLSGGAFTAFLLDSENMAAFDWITVPAPPIVCDATASPTSGTVPVTVSFQGHASGGSGGFRYNWNFGDGKTDTGESLSHTYKAGGNFTWKLTVTDAADKTCQKTGNVSFLSPLTVAVTASPRQGAPPLAVAFSCEPKGGRSPYTYAWLFGDGAAADSKAPSHTYTEAGKFESLVTVTDADGKSAAATVSIYCGIPIEPTISGVQKATDPFRLVIAGADFLLGCTVFVDGAQVPVTQYKSGSKVVAKGSGLKQMLPKGVRKCITVKNTSGGISACFFYTR
jgi:PKD repeat protein